MAGPNGISASAASPVGHGASPSIVGTP